MKKKATTGAKVWRVTIDERLDADLVKIGVATLLPGCTDLSEDALDSWSEEEVRLVHPSDYLNAFKLDKSDPLLKSLLEELKLGTRTKDLQGGLWRFLEEGQVYLVGEFEVKGKDPADPERLVTRSGVHSVLRIDRIPAIKKRHKDLYSAALKEGS
jgi:hypothetical protein